MAKQVRPQPKPRRQPRHYVKQWRQYRNLTQDQLADRVDRTRGLISQIEAGETLLTEDMMYALADALQCPQPWDLLRVNPLKEGDVVDITDMLRDASAEERAEILGFARGRIGARH